MSLTEVGAPGALRPLSTKVGDVDLIVVGDALEELAKLAPHSVDAVFADPPYNLQLDGALYRPNDTKVDGVEEAWDTFDSLAAYDRFSRAWLTLARRALKPNGTLWVIGSYHNIFRVGAALQDVGYWILNDVVWLKTNPMPNFRGRRFTNAHETLIWAVANRGRTDYTFNYRSMKAFNDDVQHRSDWTFPICGGPERLRVDGAKAHPTQKPEALVRRALLASTRPGDLVLDPFFGTGTTGAVARSLGRRFLGVERVPRYAELAERRIAAVEPAGDLTYVGAAPPPRRVPFGMLVEAGLVAPGETLTDGKGERNATVRIDGSIACGGHEGSIHKVGALVRGTAGCNGWAYWHVRRNGALVSIDALRQEARGARG